ncbi:MAG: alpha/beta fold hydrolase [Deltaproteobacteria bacterium]|nr:alpha/beta fold hydrolase [Deltaproteobacteria bacterium]
MALSAALLLSFLYTGQAPSWPASDPSLPPSALARPENMPDDPEYAPRGDPARGCTGQTALFSFTPTCAAALATNERELGTGIAADRAWLITIGRPEISVAVADTGFDLADPELVSRWRLNAGEIPAPRLGGRAAEPDANGDGAFTVQDFTTATGTTPPTAARVADDRLRARADRGDVNGNGLLDPQDLLRVFGDGADSDGNGYADDGCGWDFVEDDNDPWSEAGSGHGTHQARVIAGEANNGRGGAGVCPRCTLWPARAATAGEARAEWLAQAIVWSAERGAAVIAVGVEPSYGSSFLDQAVSYAESRGALTVTGAGNRGGMVTSSPWKRAMVVGSLGFDQSNIARATTAFAPDLCAGSSLELTAAAPGACNEDAAALAAGAAALVLSIAAGAPSRGVPPLDPALGPRELAALLAASAHAPPLPSGELAFNARLGFGRIDARAAIDAVVRRALPIDTEIQSPDSAALIDPTSGAPFTVKARVRSIRHSGVSWVLEYALGGEVSPDAFIALESGQLDGADQIVEAKVPTTGLFRDPVAQPSGPFSFALTIRVRASVELTGGVGIRSESRRVVYVHRDLRALPPFPLELGGFATASPRVADLDADGREEIVVATTDGRLELIEGTGAVKASGPRLTPTLSTLDPRQPNHHAAAAAYTTGAITSLLQPIVVTPAIAALERGSDARSLIAVTSEGVVLVYDSRGTLRDGFPAPAGRSGGLPHGPAIADLDQDGQSEIVIARRDGVVAVLGASGAMRPGFPVDLGEAIGAPALGDLDGQGDREIIIAGHDRLFAIRADGSSVPGWPVTLEAWPAGVRSLVFGPPIDPPPAPLLADADDDDAQEVVLAPIGRHAQVIEADGTPRPAGLGARELFGVRSTARRDGPPIFPRGGEIALADVDGDDRLELFGGAATLHQIEGLAPEEGARAEPMLAAWSLKSGTELPAFPWVVRSLAPLEPGPFDLDGDGRLEVLFSTGAEIYRALSAEGIAPRGWPKLLAGSPAGAAAVGQLNGDSELELLVLTQRGRLFAYRTEAGVQDVLQWDGARHDLAATGDLTTPTTVRSVASADQDCACRAARSSRAAADLWPWALLAIAWLGGRRRSIATAAVVLFGGLAVLLCAACATPAPVTTARYGFGEERSVHARRARAEVWIAALGSDPRPPLVLIHPWATNMRVWHAVAPKLARHRRVVMLDLPGHGRSGYPPGPYPPRRLAASVVDVLDTLGIERAILIGNSIGGAAAIEVALYAPERTAGLVLIGSPGGRSIPEPLQRLAVTWTAPRHLATISPRALRTAWWVAATGTSTAADVVIEDLVAARLDPSWPQRAEALSSALALVTRFEPVLRRVRAPALVVQGASDRIVPEETGVALSSALPEGELAVLDDCGHFPELDCPDALLAAMAPFLARH